MKRIKDARQTLHTAGSGIQHWVIASSGIQRRGSLRPHWDRDVSHKLDEMADTAYMFCAKMSRLELGSEYDIPRGGIDKRT